MAVILRSFFSYGSSLVPIYDCGSCLLPQADERHIVEVNPTYDELKEWYGKSGLTLKKFFNTSGLLYKEMQLKDKLPTMSEEEQIQLLATNGMLVKRPLVVNGDTVLVGFKEAEWAEKLN